MDYVTLQEGSHLTGKSEMTIRRLTKKPGGKPNVKMEDGKLYVSRDFLLKHYPPIQPIQAPIQEEPLPIQTPAEPPIQAPIQEEPAPIQKAEAAYTVDYTALLAEKEKRIEELASHLQRVNALLDQEKHPNAAVESALQVLSRQLEAKDRQLESASRQIEGLIERNRELNFIIQHKVPQQLGAPAGDINSGEAPAAPEAKPEKEEPQPQPEPAPGERPRGFWARLFS